MEFVIFLASIYAFLETAISGYFEFKENKFVWILLFILAIFCLIVPSMFA